MATGGCNNEDKLELIKNSLINFICENCKIHRVDVVSSLDEIILNYVLTILEDSLTTTAPHPHNNHNKNHHQNNQIIDVAEFSEILSAYFPPFSQIDEKILLNWLREILNEMGGGGGNGQGEQQQKSEEDEAKIEQIFKVLDLNGGGGGGQGEQMQQQMIHDNEGSGEQMDCSNSGQINNSEEEDFENMAKFRQLREVFPCHSRSDLLGALTLSKGDVEKSVQLLLLEENQELIRNFGGGNGRKISSGNSADESEEFVGKDEKLKKRITARYAFVDKKEDSKEFRPILPKEEPKKLVRYRQGQVVSTKGERFTEVAVNKNGEETPIKTYISKTAKSLQLKNLN